jgi:ABC-type multidrug transport system fused ATPase/permease subunit
MNTEDNNDTLRIFVLLFVNSFLIGAAVAIHKQGLWFPDESSWFKIGGLYMMAATFVQMVSFMLYKVFFQERMEDQTYIQNLVTQSRRNMKKMNAELQKFQMSMEMESRRRQFETAMENQKQKMEDGEDFTPIIGLEAMR